MRLTFADLVNDPEFDEAFNLARIVTRASPDIARAAALRVLRGEARSDSPAFDHGFAVGVLQRDSPLRASALRPEGVL